MPHGAGCSGLQASGPPTPLPHHVSVGCEAEAPDAQPWSPRLYLRCGELETGGKRCEGGSALNTTQLLINRLKSPLAFSLWECPALSPFNFLSYFAFFCYEDESITPLPPSCHFFGITICSLQQETLVYSWELCTSFQLANSRAVFIRKKKIKHWYFLKYIPLEDCLCSDLTKLFKYVGSSKACERD